MELSLWGTLWANCALGTFFALPNIPNIPVVPSEEVEEDTLPQIEDDNSRQDHETQTGSFSGSDDENSEALPYNSTEIEIKDTKTNISATDSIPDLQNNCSTSDSNSLHSVTFDNVEENDVKEKIKPCKQKCTKSFQRNRYNREEYRCTICPYTCTTERAFLKHLRFHTEMEENNKDQQGSSNNNQNVVPRLSCPVCGKDRTGEAALNKHMLRHRDKDRHFCCDICSFKTVQLKKLIQHRRMHTGERPHLCPHCAYRAARRDNLRSHVRRVHKKDNLTCDTFNPRGMLLIPTAKKEEDNNEENSEEPE